MIQWGGVFALLLVVGLGIGWWQNGRVTPDADQPIPLPPPPTVEADLIVAVLPEEGIPAIDAPQFEAGRTATDVEAGERIIGVEINGDARAYPLTILSSHEIVNDVVGGEPVAITWCPL